MRPDHEYNTRRVERAPARVINHERVVNQTRVVRGNTRLIQENRLIVHVRPVINREVIVHRTNTIVRDVELHRVNTTNKFREEHIDHEVVNREVPGEVRHVLEHREVRGVNCNCGPEGGRRYGGRSRLLPRLSAASRFSAASPGKPAGRFFYWPWRDASAAPDRNGAEEIALADLDAAMAGDRVGGGEVEIEIRQHEMIEVVAAVHVALGLAERKGDLALG